MIADITAHVRALMQAERDAAYRRGAEAMREAAADVLDAEAAEPTSGAPYAVRASRAIRALPIPGETP